MGIRLKGENKMATNLIHSNNDVDVWVTEKDSKEMDGDIYTAVSKDNKIVSCEYSKGIFVHELLEHKYIDPIEFDKLV